MGPASLGFEPVWHTREPAARQERCPGCGIRVERRVRGVAHLHHRKPAAFEKARSANGENLQTSKLVAGGNDRGETVANMISRDAAISGR